MKINFSTCSIDEQRRWSHILIELVSNECNNDDEYYQHLNKKYGIKLEYSSMGLGIQSIEVPDSMVTFLLMKY